MTTTCQKCIHYEICKTRIDFNEYALEMRKFKCPDFKNNADVVEVVRCKDCEYFIERNGSSWCEEHSDGWGDNIIYVDKNDFCSYGVKEEGAEE